MNEVKSQLKPKCDKCNLFEPDLLMTTAYDFPNEIIKREITVTCKNMTLCGMYKEFNNPVANKLQELLDRENERFKGEKKN
jgi:hypothetical protein